MNKNKKDTEAAAHFHIKAAKVVQVIIILKKFVMEKSFFVISSILEWTHMQAKAFVGTRVGTIC